MAALTEKDLEQRRDRIAKLREQIAQQEAKASVSVQEKSMEIEAASLDAEAAKLEAQLNAAKEAAKVTNVRQGAAGPLAAVSDQLEAAKAGVTPPGVAVDTNKQTEAPAEDKQKDGGNS